MNIVKSYIARCKCGCGGLVFAMVDTPELAKETAHEVSELIKDGYHIESMSVEDVRKAPWGCKEDTDD